MSKQATAGGSSATKSWIEILPGSVLTEKKLPAKGYLTILLHAHLPYVVNHGTWPHGIEWLHELTAETYLPLLRILNNLSRDGIRANWVVSFSPVLLEQLAHPHFLSDFPKYLERKIVAAREDESYFVQSGDSHLTELARYWGRFFSTVLSDFQQLNGDIVGAFRRFQDEGAIEIITSAATHGYIPLLGTDESVWAQIRGGVDTHVRHFGVEPQGIWLPECGYRPSGLWQSAVTPEGSDEPIEAERVGVESILAQCGLRYFCVDAPMLSKMTIGMERDAYRTYRIADEVSIFVRDPVTGTQVWSPDIGYPGEFLYLDFHKKRYPGGHRYWKVSGAEVGTEQKQVYSEPAAREKVNEHAQHFVSLVRNTLERDFNESDPPVLCAPFDAELFGHWWFEGPMWLEAVCRILHQEQTEVSTITCRGYVARTPCVEVISLGEGSWGFEGQHTVWMNPKTSWTYRHIYSAELYTRKVAREGKWKRSAMGERIVKQLCRELLLLESSDWQSLITTGAARDYGEMRFLTHQRQFEELKTMWERFEGSGMLGEPMLERLRELESRDGIFPDIHPEDWAVNTGASRPR